MAFCIGWDVFFSHVDTKLVFRAKMDSSLDAYRIYVVCTTKGPTASNLKELAGTSRSRGLTTTEIHYVRASPSVAVDYNGVN